MNKLVLHPRTMTYLFDTHLKLEERNSNLYKKIPESKEHKTDANKCLEVVRVRNLSHDSEKKEKKSQRVKPQQYVNGNK